MTGCMVKMAKRLILWCISVVCALGMTPTWGQSSNAVPVSNGPIVTPYNTPAINAPVRVCLYSSFGTPCNTTGVTLYSDANLQYPINDPAATNAQGIYNFYLNASQYTLPQLFLIQISVTQTLTYTYQFLITSSSSFSGVTEITPGTNITCSPESSGSCTGNVTVNSSGSGGGPPYNPSTTAYYLLGSSAMGDDGHTLSTAVPVSTAVCNGTTCTVTTTSPHNLTAGWSYVDMTQITGWFTGPVWVNPTVGTGLNQSTGLGSFLVQTTPTSTTFTIDYTLNTGTLTGGNIYDADYWGAYETAHEPLIWGHGTFTWLETSMAVLDSNFANMVKCTSGSPTYMMIYGGQNDIYSGVSTATLEGYYQAIWEQGHSAGCTIDQIGLTPGDYGAFGTDAMWTTTNAINLWFPSQRKTFANASGGEYVDRYSNPDAFLWYWTPTGTGYQQNFADLINQSVAPVNAGLTGPPPVLGYYQSGGGGDDYVRMAGLDWHLVNSSGGTSIDFNGPASTISQFPAVNGTDDNWTINSILDGSMGIGGAICNLLGYNTSANNYGQFCFNYAGSESTSNYLSLVPTGDSQTTSPWIKFFMQGAMQFPNLTAASGTQPLVVDTSGNVTVGSGGGGGGLADPGANGIVKRIALDTTAVSNANDLAAPLTGATGGTSDAITLTISPTISSLETGTVVWFGVSYNNTTTSPTLNVDGIGAATITKCADGEALAVNDLASNMFAEVIYDSVDSEWTLINPNAVACATAGGVTWPASTDVVISNSSDAPAGVAPVNGDCLIGAAGAWEAGSCSGSGNTLNGTVTYTSNQTASSGDAGKLVIMNCSSACAYTLPATQPTTTWNIWLISTGSTVATVTLGGSDTFNGSASAPVLNSFRVVPIWANTATSTDYRGDAPLVAGTNVTFTAASNGMTIAASGSSSYTVPHILQATYVAMTSSSTVASITSPSITVTAGDWVSVFCMARGTTLTSIAASDSVSDSFTALSFEANSTTSLSQMSWTVAAGGSTTFTCTPNTSSGYQSMVVIELTGSLGTVNTSKGTTGDSGTISITSITTSARTFGIQCAAVTTTTDSLFPGQPGSSSYGILETPSALVMNDQGSTVAASNGACEWGIVPYAAAGNVDLGASAGQNFSTTFVAVNY